MIEWKAMMKEKDCNNKTGCFMCTLKFDLTKTPNFKRGIKQLHLFVSISIYLPYTYIDPTHLHIPLKLITTITTT